MKTLFTTLLLIVMTLSFQKSNAQAGLLDTSFNHTGKVTTAFAIHDYAYAVAIQTDGKIVAAGSSSDATKTSFAVSRYNADGTLDNTFGTGGKTTTYLGASFFSDVARAVAIQADGKIVLAGYATGGSGLFALVRYKANGIVDSTFGTSGVVTNVFGSVGYGMTLQGDGKIVVVGGGFSSWALARYTTNGSPDNTFGGSGVVTITIGSQGNAYAVALQQDGKIVAAGTSTNGGVSSFTLVRYKTVGVIDSTFGTNGIVTTSIGTTATAYAVGIQADGKIVASGVSGTGAAAVFTLARYDSTNGALDASFGTGGIVTTAIGSSGNTAQGMAVQADGKIVAAGFAGNGFAAARYIANGTLDNAFGTGGKVTTTFTGSSSRGEAVAIQAGGKIVVAGYSTVSASKDEFALARYYGSGTVGITGIYEEVGISIYPNPLISSSTLQLSTQLKDAEVTIYNMLGMEMLRKKLTGNKMEIEKGSLESGVYFVRVSGEDRQWVEKVVVE